MKVKLAKGELKRQRDDLLRYERYLPTLQLKKQQLQFEISQQINLLGEKRGSLQAKKKAAHLWLGLLAEPPIDLRPWLKPSEVIKGTRNIAGVDIPYFERVVFAAAEYDLFTMPLWVDAGLETLRSLISWEEEIRTIQEGIDILRWELRITTQRVNLFEKVKIPEAKEAIRLIKIYLGDQLANSVGRSKIAKAKIEEAILEVAQV